MYIKINIITIATVLHPKNTNIVVLLSYIVKQVYTNKPIIIIVIITGIIPGAYVSILKSFLY